MTEFAANRIQYLCHATRGKIYWKTHSYRKDVEMKCIVREGFVREELGIRDKSMGWGSINKHNRAVAGFLFAPSAHAA